MNDLNDSLPPILPTRTCANCACHTVQENQLNKLERQYFCRRDTPIATQWRGERPRMKDGHPVLDRNNKVLMEPHQEIIYLYKPTLPELVCFDGWRPEGTLPGERHEINELVQPLMDNLQAAMGNLLQDATEARSLEQALTEGKIVDARGKKN